MEEVFTKELTQTDINHRLSFPAEHLNILPSVEDERDVVNFQVRCGNQMHTFCCRKRRNGALKPTIENGWSAVVRDHNLQIGDILKFYMDPDHNGVALFQIEIHRWVSYDNEMGTPRIHERVV